MLIFKGKLHLSTQSLKLYPYASPRLTESYEWGTFF